eukprot:comp21971_c0_seq1/m.31713 comp21971_c0_seq1/g.31713  ORF comp21971_c0_seq1/g.31713 comp21971_c0_seq1/m.31713 type:complete len:292 (-) comp21971_c0_seq1:260-1135(-)
MAATVPLEAQAPNTATEPTPSTAERRASNPLTALASLFSLRPLVDTQVQAGFACVWAEQVVPRQARKEVWATHVLLDRPLALGMSLWVPHIAVLDLHAHSLALLDHRGEAVVRADISHARVFRKHGDCELHVVTADCDVTLRLGDYRQRDELLGRLQGVRSQALGEREAKLRKNPFIRYGKKVAWIGRRRVEDIVRDEQRAQEESSDLSSDTDSPDQSQANSRRWHFQKLDLGQRSTEDLRVQIEHVAGGMDAAERALFVANMQRMTEALVEENNLLATQQLALRARLCAQ